MRDCIGMSYVILGLVIFIAFSIGLNLGLHGVINVHNTGPATSQRGVKESEEQRKERKPELGILVAKRLEKFTECC